MTSDPGRTTIPMNDDEEQKHLNHITRTGLPWRPADRTICGRPLAELAEGVVLTLADARAKQKRLGQQRFAMVICMTCARHVTSWAEWDRDPVARFARELGNGFGGGRAPELEAELRAIAALIAEHREQFDDMVSALMSPDVVRITDLQAARAKRTR